MHPLLFFEFKIWRLARVIAGLLLVLRFASPAWAQAPSFGRVIPLVDSGTAQASQTVSDAQGNVYVCGFFEGSTTFGSTVLTSVGSQDIFVAKLDAAGNYVWATQAGGLGYDGASSLALDANGSLYVTGGYSGPAVFGLTTLNALPSSFLSSDVFVGRLDGAGNWLWVRNGGSNRSDGASTVVVDASGNAYVGGSFSGTTAQFGSYSIANVDPMAASISDLFIAKLDALGNWRWVRGGGSSGYDWVRTLALDGAGHLFAYGNFQSYILTLGALPPVLNNGFGSDDAFVAQLDTAGTWRWGRAAGGNFIEYVGNMSLDDAGNAYIAGSFRSPSMNFGSLQITNESPNQIGDVYVAKLDGAGNWLWARKAGGSGGDGATGLAVSPTGDVTLSGSFASRTSQFGATSLPNTSSFTTTNTGIANYLTDAFLARLDSNGNWQWAISSQGAGNEAGQSVSLDAAGNVLLTGAFQGATASFGFATLTGSSTAPTSYLAFVPGALSLAIATMAPSSGAPGQVVTLTGTGFVGVTAVQFNGIPAASFSVQSTSRLEAVVPAGATTGPVSVFTSRGTVATTVPFQPAVLAVSIALPVSKLRMYPNPATTIIRLAGVSVGSYVQLLDAVGRSAHSSFVSSDGTVSFQGVTPGLYGVQVSDAQGRQYIGRLVVE